MKYIKTFEKLFESKKEPSLLSLAIDIVKCWKDKKLDDDDKIEEFKEKFTQKHGSAMDVWMDEEQLHDLIKKYATDKYEWKTIVIDTETKEDAVDNNIDKMKAKGWKVYCDCDNMEQTEIIYHKKK